MAVRFHDKNIRKLIQEKAESVKRFKRFKRVKSTKKLQKVSRSKKQSRRSRSQNKQERYWDLDLECTKSGYIKWTGVVELEYDKDFKPDTDVEFECESVREHIYDSEDSEDSDSVSEDSVSEDSVSEDYYDCADYKTQAHIRLDTHNYDSDSDSDCDYPSQPMYVYDSDDSDDELSSSKNPKSNPKSFMTVRTVLDSLSCWNPYKNVNYYMTSARSGLSHFVSSSTSNRKRKSRERFVRQLSFLLSKLDYIPFEKARSEQMVRKLIPLYEELFFHPVFASYVECVGSQHELEEYNARCDMICYSYKMSPLEYYRRS